MAFPNPFDPNDIAHPLRMLIGANTGEAVSVYIFDSSGRIVWEYKGNLAANMEVRWDGSTSYGEVATNGVYLVRAVSGSTLLSKGKILVIKHKQ